MGLPKNRQLRMQITGGEQDVQGLAHEVKAFMLSKGISATDWELSWDQFKAFGEEGPIRKATLGFTTKR